MRLPNDDATNGWRQPAATPRPALLGRCGGRLAGAGRGLCGTGAASPAERARTPTSWSWTQAPWATTASGRTDWLRCAAQHWQLARRNLRQAAHYQACAHGMTHWRALVAAASARLLSAPAAGTTAAVSPAMSGAAALRWDEFARPGALHALRTGTPTPWPHLCTLLRSPGSAASTALINPPRCAGADRRLPAITCTSKRRCGWIVRRQVVAHTRKGRVQAPQLLLAANNFAQQGPGLFGSAWRRNVSAGHLWLAHRARSRPSSAAACAREWGVTPASAVTGDAALRTTTRILVRQGFEYTPHFPRQPTVRENWCSASTQPCLRRFPQLSDVALEHFGKAPSPSPATARRVGGWRRHWVHGVRRCNGAGVVKFTALGQDNPLLAAWFWVAPATAVGRSL